MTDDTPQDKPVRIRRAVRNENHPYFSNSRAAAQDTKLTYEAAGLLWYLLSKPDTWRVIPKALQRKGTAKNRIYRLLTELIDVHYLERIYHRDDKGKIVEVEYVIHETPYPFPTNQEMGNQEMEKGDNRYKREVESKENKVIASATPDALLTPKKTTIPKADMTAMKDAIVAALRWDVDVISQTQWGAIQKTAKELIQIGCRLDEVIHLKRECDARQYRGYGSPALAKVAVDVLPRIRQSKTSTPDVEPETDTPLSYQERMQLNLMYGQMAQGGGNGNAG